ncbi:MAG: hypothetical protein OEY14_12570 [Myxococcales bacterium]|nr:hypothetical protein [Myxococcales bacterium]
MGAAAWRTASLADGLLAAKRWIPAAAMGGTLPLLAALPWGGGWHQGLSGLLLALLWLAAIRRDAMGIGVGIILVGFASHAALAIALSCYAPALAEPVLIDGAAYWEAQVRWIRSGWDPEYELINWLPAHVQLAAAVALFSYLSLGGIAILHGFYEVDLMNFYVGRLLAGAERPLPCLLVGWHPWSVMRGLCYAFLVFEVASLSLSRLSGRVLCTRARRVLRWKVAALFFVADCGLKAFALEPVRATLERCLG